MSTRLNSKFIKLYKWILQHYIETKGTDTKKSTYYIIPGIISSKTGSINWHWSQEIGYLWRGEGQWVKDTQRDFWGNILFPDVYADYNYLYMFLCDHKYLILLFIYLGVELRIHIVVLCLLFWKTAKQLSKVDTPFYIPTNTVRRFGSNFSIF